MKILVYGINYLLELIGIGKYIGEMVVWMVWEGYEVWVIIVLLYYLQWKVGECYFVWCYCWEEGEVIVWCCLLYVLKQFFILK